MQIEHVANAEKYWTCNRNKLIQKWHEKPEEQNSMQKRTENTASRGITTREYSSLYIFTDIKFTNISSKQ